jgi:hypothetical protein
MGYRGVEVHRVTGFAFVGDRPRDRASWGDSSTSHSSGRRLSAAQSLIKAEIVGTVWFFSIL